MRVVKSALAAGLFCIIGAHTALADGLFQLDASELEVLAIELEHLNAEADAACVDCSTQKGPADGGACNGTCPTATDVCVPNVGNVARPVTAGKTCTCVPAGEEKCDAYETRRNGKKRYLWTFPDTTSCKYGKCPDKQECKSSTQSNGDPSCKCEAIPSPSGGDGGRK